MALHRLLTENALSEYAQLGQPAQCTNLIQEKLLKHQSQGGSSQPPCVNYCEQVITRCVGRGNLDQLSDRWKAYVTLLAELAKKLSVHYNIETIIAPLDVQISEAIMNFQEGAPNMTQYVYQACSHLLVRNANTNSNHMVASDSASTQQIKPMQHGNRVGKRAAPHTFEGSSFVPPNTSAASRQFRGRQQPINSPPIATPSSSSSDKSALLEGIVSPSGKRSSPIIIDEIKDFMISTRNFWSNFPKSICTSNYTLGATNATARIRQQVSNCFTEPLTNADVNSDLRYRTEINLQVHRLDLMNSRIESSLTGAEIGWATSGDSRNNPVIINPTADTENRPIHIQSTTTTIMPNLPEDDDGSSEDDSIETGSGNGSDDTNLPGEDDPLDTEEPDEPDETSSPQPETAEDNTTPPPPQPQPPNTDEPDNRIDVLIPAPDSRTSAARRLVDSVIIQFLLVVLSIVNYRRHQIQVIV